MRFAPECKWGANAGLDVARQILEPIKQRNPAITYADLWTLAGAVAVEHVGGPKVSVSSARYPHGPHCCSIALILVPLAQSSLLHTRSRRFRGARAARTRRTAPRPWRTGDCPTRGRAATTSARSSTGWASGERAHGAKRGREAERERERGRDREREGERKGEREGARGREQCARSPACPASHRLHPSAIPPPAATARSLR